MSLNLSLTSLSVALMYMLLATPGLAQQQALTVQLPVVNQFNVNSRVGVPDGGEIRLGGISRSATGTTSRGLPGFGRPFANRSRGYQTSQGQASVRVRVMSNREINDAILAGASPARPAPVPYYKEVWARQRNAAASQK